MIHAVMNINPYVKNLRERFPYGDCRPSVEDYRTAGFEVFLD
jgi:hypothetical protein